jgi:Xaa-Pro dipeptidase
MPIGAYWTPQGWQSIVSPRAGILWMDWPMLFSGNPVLAEPGMVFFLHCVVADSGRGVAMSLGRTCLVTDAGREVLSARPLEFIVV